MLSVHSCVFIIEYTVVYYLLCENCFRVARISKQPCVHFTCSDYVKLQYDNFLTGIYTKKTTAINPYSLHFYILQRALKLWLLFTKGVLRLPIDVKH